VARCGLSGLFREAKHTTLTDVDDRKVRSIVSAPKIDRLVPCAVDMGDLLAEAEGETTRG